VGIDALSDVLKTVRLNGAIVFDIDAYAPWGVETPPPRLFAPLVMPEADHIIEYHVITEGCCYASVAGEQPVRVEAGTVVMFPQGDAQVLSNPAGLRRKFELEEFEQARRATPQLPIGIVTPGNGEHTHIVCGFLGCDAAPFNPLLAALPRMVCVSEALSLYESRIGQLAHFALAEAKSKRSGGESVLARLCELMFVEAVRRYVDTLTGDHAGWLAGLRDRHVGAALSLIHARPSYDWTLDSLAREAGASRTVLAERFVHFVGTPPMQYLSRWRMQIAASLLCDGQANLARIAEVVGYESEASFSRAFKKVVGSPPGTWRRGRARRAVA